MTDNLYRSIIKHKQLLKSIEESRRKILSYILSFLKHSALFNKGKYHYEVEMDKNGVCSINIYAKHPIIKPLVELRERESNCFDIVSLTYHDDINVYQDLLKPLNELYSHTRIFKQS